MNNSLDALGLINEIKADVLLQKCSLRNYSLNALKQILTTRFI